MSTIFTNGRLFAPTDNNEDNFLEAMVVTDNHIQHVGKHDDAEIIQARTEGATEVDLQNHIVVPGFIDSHVHILDFALSLRKLHLLSCKSLHEIRQKIKIHAEIHPGYPRITCKGWIQSSTDGLALASMLDDLDPRPIYIQANDLHSVWCNTAALEELGVDAMSDPAGGTIHRDENGKPSGLLTETAALMIVMPFLIQVTSIEDKLSALDYGAAAYSAAGYTGMIDMAVDESLWKVFNLYRERHQGKTPFHLAMHWLVPFSEDQEEVFKHVDRAISLHQEFNAATSPAFCIAGIKLMTDGVVDGCTAALSQPYGGSPSLIDPTWPAEALQAVVKKADSAGLQCAIHAIGDQAVKQAIDALSQVQPGQRHRIEHLELTSPEDAKRLGQHGITASVQPVHSDPVLFRAWPHLIGSHRCGRAFAYKEFLDGGAPVAIGTDAPTADHFALPNLYNATTRRSVIEPESTEVVNEHFGLSMAAAFTAATKTAAFSRFAESWTGSLAAGLSADFVVLEMDWKPERLLQARVQQTWFQGRKTFDACM
ncbi:hypothetical protein ASPWEDRAFT_45383 [Aspergillus wentii DTO 134E9]|uniref:Amidohydrolase 3 domain-containing protein n=1 Tax=Aspergillus wentii DTO 134E9 TaxID=1073089 RepID=A0A1L9R954_ASPWE|nr:uncharacterized protein ASPWEDRAFT_45383 [Aspergillus wentii DTO 134E9]OJJ31454.1 hypothetical protein ASPWEDRAFT_45383 [Aspergillus wentii DTO 134E9]